MRGHQVQADTTHEPAAEQAPQRTRSELDDLMLKMEILEPGDHKLVAMLLEQHPELRDAIIAKAQEVCGNDTVAKALELLAKPKAKEKAAGDSATTSAGSSATTDATATAPAPENAGETIASAKQGGVQAAEDFTWITSPLALEYDHAERVRDHVDFIHKNPQLRDKVIAGAAEFEPDLARDVERALRGEAPPQPAAASATASSTAAAAEPAPADTANAAQTFEYLTSFLALEYDREEKIKDHVDFILANPHLRDQVLLGAAEFDAPLAEEVRQRLANPTAAASTNEPEPASPDAVAKEAEQAAPPPASAPKKKASPKDASSAEAKTDKPEPGWVKRARVWNANHPEFVEPFLSFTGAACLDAEGNLDPRLVARWQADHNSPPDGRVGAGTLGRAIEASALDDAANVAEAASTPPPEA